MGEGCTFDLRDSGARVSLPNETPSVLVGVHGGFQPLRASCLIDMAGLEGLEGMKDDNIKPRGIISSYLLVCRLQGRHLNFGCAGGTDAGSLTIVYPLEYARTHLVPVDGPENT